jgi:tryptophan 2,3-dioxygenase
MKQELLDRIHDQTRIEMGFCVQAKDGNWCDRHEALKFPGEEACQVLLVAYVVAESAVEVAEDLIRADERERLATHEAVQSSHIGMLLREATHAEAVAARLVEVICAQDDALADLRAKVESLPRTGGGRMGSGFVAMPGDGDRVPLADVLDLIDEAMKP